MINDIDLTKYINKSRINKSALKNMHLDNFKVKDVKQAFDEIYGERFLTGNKINKNQQKHTKFVNKFELYNKVIKE